MKAANFPAQPDTQQRQQSFRSTSVVTDRWTTGYERENRVICTHKHTYTQASLDRRMRDAYREQYYVISVKTRIFCFSAHSLSYAVCEPVCLSLSFGLLDFFSYPVQGNDSLPHPRRRLRREKHDFPLTLCLSFSASAYILITCFPSFLPALVCSIVSLFS